MLATGGCVTGMLIARKEAEQEPIKQRIKQYKNQAYEFGFAAESAYQMATTQTRYKKLAEADEVAFESEIETAYMESLGLDPSQQQPLLTGTATLESVNNPSDKVEGVETPTTVAVTGAGGTDMVILTYYPSVLVYGVPGAGKTHFVEQEVKRRLALGHQVVVLDPHSAYGQWFGCEVIGGGMDYQAINAKLRWFKQQVANRYKLRQSQPNPTFKPLTIVGEEFTNWADRCEESDEHYRTCNTDIRKVECYSIIVSHLSTQAGLGDGKGLAKLKTGMVEVEVLGIFNPVTKRATPKFEAWVKLPGQKQSERTLVKLTKHPEPTASQPASQANPTESDSDYLNRVYKLEFDLGKSETVSDEFQAVKQPDSNESTDEGVVYFTNLNLDRKQAHELILKLKLEAKHSQTEIIWMLWGVRPGKTKAYETAVSEYKELLAEGEEGK